MLAFFVIVFVLASGYYSFQLSKEKENVQVKERENAELLAKLRDPLLESTIENARVTSVNASERKITIQGAGQGIAFTVPGSASIQRVVLAMDKKTKAWQDAKLSDVKKGKKVKLRFNALKEVTYLSFSGN